MPALLSIIVLLMPFIGFITLSSGGEQFLVIYEVSAAAIACTTLLLLSGAQATTVHRGKFCLLAGAMLSASCAEAICGVGFLSSNIGMRGQSYAEIFYILFWACLIGLMRWNYGPVNGQRSWVVGCALAGIFVASYWLQCRFILPTESVLAGNWLRVGYMHLWLILKSVALVASMSYSARVLDAFDLVFLQSIVALFCTAFGAAHEATETGFGSMRWYEAGWAASLGIILLVLLHSLRHGKPLFVEAPALSPWYSLRSAIGISVFVANSVVVAGIALVDLLTHEHALSVSLLLILMFGSWAIENAFAFHISRRIARALAYVPTIPDDAISDSTWTSLKEFTHGGRRLLSEFSTMLDKYIGLAMRMAELKLSAAEVEKEAEIGRLAEQVAHDIRSPLAALQLVLRDADGLPPESRELAYGATQRVHDIANSLLARSRAQKMPQRAPVLLRDVVEQIVAEKRLGLAHTPLLFIESAADALSQFCFVNCQRAQVAAAISNLINNAAEALDNRGRIVVSLAARKNNEVMCVIADNGPGIAPNVLAKLGRKGATFGKANGNGLGLYSARVTVEQIGGSLEITSVVGQGTQVELRLPTCAAPGNVDHSASRHGSLATKTA